MSDMNELFEKWSKIKKIHRFEGQTGVGYLTILVQDIGYDGIEDFLENNSGAIEKIVDFIASNDVPEWQSNLDDAIKLHEQEEEEEKSLEWNPKRGIGTGFVAIQSDDVEDEIWWCVVSKEFWEENHYLNDGEDLPIIPEFSEIMESTYEYQEKWFAATKRIRQTTLEMWLDKFKDFPEFLTSLKDVYVRYARFGGSKEIMEKLQSM